MEHRTQSKKLCFYESGSLSIIDTIKEGTDKSFYMNESLEQIKTRYPKAEIVPFDYAIEQINEAKKDAFPLLQPVEITEDQWYDALECLPPMQMQRGQEGTTFKMSELIFMDVTSGYVAKKGKFYNMNVLLKTSSETMLAVCN